MFLGTVGSPYKLVTHATINLGDFTMKFDPTNTLGIAQHVHDLGKPSSAILGQITLGGIGPVTLFSDVQARKAYGEVVQGGLTATGQFLTTIQVEEKGEPVNVDVPVVWGQRPRR